MNVSKRIEPLTKAFETSVNIGIGGSDLGPLLRYYRNGGNGS